MAKKNKYARFQEKKRKEQKLLLKKPLSFLENKIAILDKKIEVNKKENSRLYSKMATMFDVWGYKTKKEAEVKGFKEGAKVRIKETNELPKHLRKRREKDFWKWFDISGIREIGLSYCDKNTGRPHIDKDKSELIVLLRPHLERKDKGNGITPIVRLSDIELIKEFERGEKVIYDNKKYDFGYIGGTGLAIIYEEGERNMQDAIAVNSNKLKKA